MSNLLEIRFPDDQQEGTEAVLLKWLKAPGETVSLPPERLLPFGFEGDPGTETFYVVLSPWSLEDIRRTFLRAGR